MTDQFVQDASRPLLKYALVPALGLHHLQRGAAMAPVCCPTFAVSTGPKESKILLDLELQALKE